MRSVMRSQLAQTSSHVVWSDMMHAVPIRRALSFHGIAIQPQLQRFHASALNRMPVLVHPELEAFEKLKAEGVWVDPKSAPASAKPHLKIGLMNLMPLKQPTETQILRMMGRSPAHVDLTLFVPDTYAAKNTPPEYLKKFYKRWSEIKSDKFDGFILTGAPIETLPFEEVRAESCLDLNSMTAIIRFY
jgi:hypothetical protein